MNLRTTWLGLDLPHPLVVGASPICDDLDLVRRCEDAGAAAIVMHSLFEEHEYESLSQAQGSLRLARCARPEQWERGNYLRILQGFSRP